MLSVSIGKGKKSQEVRLDLSSHPKEGAMIEFRRKSTVFFLITGGDYSL